MPDVDTSHATALPLTGPGQLVDAAGCVGAARPASGSDPGGELYAGQLDADWVGPQVTVPLPQPLPIQPGSTTLMLPALTVYAPPVGRKLPLSTIPQVVASMSADPWTATPMPLDGGPSV